MVLENADDVREFLRERFPDLRIEVSAEHGSIVLTCADEVSTATRYEVLKAVDEHLSFEMAVGVMLAP